MRRIAGAMLIGVLFTQPAFLRAASSSMEVSLTIRPQYRIEMQATGIPDLALSTGALAPLEVQLILDDRTVPFYVAWIGDRYVAKTHTVIAESDSAVISIF